MRIAVAGNPNCGKTTIFNGLTGANQKVGNYPGVTVEKKMGTLKIGEEKHDVVDLPGAYSLSAYSEDELVARNYIIEEKPDLIINVVDSSNLERNLYLTVQLMEMQVPLLIVLNMQDAAVSKGLNVEAKKLSELIGAPVVSTVGHKKEGIKKLKEEISKSTKDISFTPISYGKETEYALSEIQKTLDELAFSDSELNKYSKSWFALKLLEQDMQITKIFQEQFHEKTEPIVARINKYAKHVDATLDDTTENIISSYRYGFASSVVKQCITKTFEARKSLSDTIDLFITNRLLGPIILLLVLWFSYQVIFTASEHPVAWLESFFEFLHNGAAKLIPKGLFQSLVVSGIIDGVGGVLGFIPLIMFMFFLISFIEDSGYMARIAFIMDRILRTFGMHGNSILSFIVSGGIAGGCAVPGVMATRTLRDPKERLATILTTPFMNCGAKLPVFALLITAFFSKNQGMMMFFITLLSWFFALVVAGILRKTLLKGTPTPFVLELPPYRMPTLKGLLIHMWERSWVYIKKAGTFILVASIIMWILMTFPQYKSHSSRKMSEAELAQKNWVILLQEELEWL